jgi:HSP20 family protein
MRRLMVQYPSRYRQMGTPNYRFNGGSRMPLDIAVTDEEFLVTADIPGVNPESVEVKFEEGILHLRAQIEGEKDASTVVRERRLGSVSRSFRIPDSVEADAIEAWAENGVLTVRLPKAEAARPKQIEVKAR